MIAELRPFQKNTVAAVLKAWTASQGSGRFLVADEVGLGKTMVARGVIEGLLKTRRSSLRVFYLASGGKIGSQNSGRLIPGDIVKPSAVDRLGLMHQQNGQPRTGLQLFTFTPETSFRIRGTGAWKERAFLRALLRTRIYREFTRAECRQLERLIPFHGQMKKERFEYEARRYVRANRPSKGLSETFARVLKRRYGARPYSYLTTQAKASGGRTIALLRRALAEAELSANAPDVLICDEFQKYRELLLGDASRNSELKDKTGSKEAHPEQALMNSLLAGRAGEPIRVLLLSATPFRLYAERWQEAAEPEGTQELFDLLTFLGGSELSEAAKTLFGEFNIALRQFATASDEDAAGLKNRAARCKARIEEKLRPVLCRTERPQSTGQSPLSSRNEEPLNAQDVAGFQHVARVLGAEKASTDPEGKYRLSAVPYWGSVPFPVQTLGMGYVAWKRASENGMIQSTKTGPVLRKAVSRNQNRVLTAHPKLRHLQKIHPPEASALPWVAPSLPWWDLEGGWKRANAKEFGGPPEKLLLFTHFRAAPQSISALTSLAVEAAVPRRGAAGKKTRPLQMGAKAMGTFLLFHPSPWLIRNTDPLEAAGCGWKEVLKAVKGQVRCALKAVDVEIVSKVQRRSIWMVLAGLERTVGMHHQVRKGWREMARRSSAGGAEDGSRAVHEVVERWQAGAADVSAVSRQEVIALALLALEAPGIVAGRTLFRHDRNVLEEHFTPLVSLCWHGLANYLGDPTFRGATKARGSVQRQIRDWVREGCLESVLDEHLTYTKGIPGTENKTPAESLEQTLRIHAGSATFHPAGRGGDTEKFRVRCHAAVPFGGNEH